MFITFEGIDGSGKSTVIKHIERLLKEEGLDVLSLNDPSHATEELRDIRNLIMSDVIHSHTEFLLFQASRAELIEHHIKPHLEKGGVVLCDRFMDSTYAYQGYGRRIPRHIIAHLQSFIVGRVEPNMTFYLDIPIEVGQRRIHTNRTEELNRMDRETVEFYRRVVNGYGHLMRNNPRIIRIDADRDIQSIVDDIAIHIKEYQKNQRLSDKKGEDR